VVNYPIPAFPTLRQQWNARVLVAVMEEFPNYKYMRQHGRGVNQADHKDQTWSQYLVPLCTSSGYFSAEFWKGRYETYGLQALRIPQILRQKRSNGKYSLGALEACEPKSCLKENRDELMQVRAECCNIQRTWARLRQPW
jgi:hypothetical protein